MLDRFDYVFVGVGHFCYRAAKLLDEQRPSATMLFVNDEPCQPYRRKKVHPKFERIDVEEFSFPPLWNSEGRELRFGTTATRIDPANRTVLLSDGRRAGYEILFLGPGSVPRGLGVPGSDLPGVDFVWGIQDAQRLVAERDEFDSVLIAGMGVIGLEALHEFTRAGKKITIVERAPFAMPGRFNEPTSIMIADAMRALGATVINNASVHSIRKQGEKLAVQVDESVHEVDRVLVAIGVVPRIELARASGLRTATGIIVDEHLRTSDPRVFCGGDAAEYPPGEISQKESVASHQGEIAAWNALGIESIYTPMRYRIGIELGERRFATFGAPRPGTPGVEEVERFAGETYTVLYVQDDVVIGATVASPEKLNERLVELIKGGASRSTVMREFQT